ncbi:Uu.00g115240.m01.CDS01 [Anthostomella pinea]|uniref:Uu.00g115240.m01.CDS01 n=1 Tax=Anthostomella pinea TaxID=933095 RepID=A0AAI8VFU5_9PEZI|nr:Uu.00g115240.m01.CDS01 [Anthostomella pinea]
MLSSSSKRRKAMAMSIALTCLFMLLVCQRAQVFSRNDEFTSDLYVPQQQDGPLEIELVVASTKDEDTAWLQRHVPEWRKSIYIVDDTKASPTVPKNKGREAMVYITYIIDHYDRLPSAIIFLHASRFAWHNDDPDYDGLRTLRNFQVPYLQETGYVNLRCVWTIGCPAEIHPVEDEASADPDDLTTKVVYKQDFQELMPELPMPEVVAVSCCSQFGVTRDVVRSRSKEDYMRYRQWLLDTPLNDSLTGRIFEFSWHSK